MLGCVPVDPGEIKTMLSLQCLHHFQGGEVSKKAIFGAEFQKLLKQVGLSTEGLDSVLGILSCRQSSMTREHCKPNFALQYREERRIGRSGDAQLEAQRMHSSTKV